MTPMTKTLNEEEIQALILKIEEEGYTPTLHEGAEILGSALVMMVKTLADHEKRIKALEALNPTGGVE